MMRETRHLRYSFAPRRLELTALERNATMSAALGISWLIGLIAIIGLFVSGQQVAVVIPPIKVATVTDSELPPEQLLIRVGTSQLSLNNSLLPRGELEQQLMLRLQRDPAQPVYLDIDASVHYRDAVSLIQSVQQCGAKSIVIAPDLSPILDKLVPAVPMVPEDSEPTSQDGNGRQPNEP